MPNRALATSRMSAGAVDASASRLRREAEPVLEPAAAEALPDAARLAIESVP